MLGTAKVDLVTYLLIVIADFIGALPVLVWLFGEAPGATIRVGYRCGDKEVNEAPTFRALEAQGAHGP